MTNVNKDKTWLITGCSSGLGLALARRVIDDGYRVAVTARNADALRGLVEGNERRVAAFELDVTEVRSIDKAVAAIVERFGSIDVLVNNAGRGHFGAIEESDMADVRALFEVNLFGLAAMTAAVLPRMRRQRSGHILNVASAGGIVAFPGVGFYNASKWAVFGLSEALSKEVAPLGIRVTTLAPSGVRVRDAGGAAHFHLAPVRSEDYAPTVGAMREGLVKSFGRQPGDPARAAEVIVRAVEDEGSPFRVLLGKAAVTYARQRAQELRDDADAWAERSEGVDFPDAARESF